MPREVELKLDELLKEHAPEMSSLELGKRIGVGEATVSAYRHNRWRVLDRTALERLADVFHCDVSSLLTTHQHSFFEPFLHIPVKDRYPVPTCIFLRRPDANTAATKRPLAYRDYRALDRVFTLLREWVEGIVDTDDSVTTTDQFEERLSQSCVVIGSPLVNPAAEMAICRAFGVEPFNPEHRGKLPLAFRMLTSKYPVSAVLEEAHDGKFGIALRREKKFLAADTWPKETFRQVDIKKGRDCALVMVMHHHPTPQKDYVRKLILLSGFSGVGTEAAAMALVDSYRDLEPLEREEETLVWGLIEVFYKKRPHDTTREFLSYKWRYRVGGRAPISWANKE
jgi:hypothetical protein